MNSESRRPGLPFWPFVILDVLFLGMAVVIYRNTPRPLPTVDSALLIASVVGAAISIGLPFLRRNTEENALAQAQMVADAVNEIKKLETVSQQINSATSQWQGVQEHAAKTVDAAREVSDSMAAEAKAFVEFLKKANESEKAHLRVEVDKLRRAEGQWLEVIVRLMDHAHALNQAAIQTGKAQLISQIGQFYNNCRETARRVGLVPVFADAGADYDTNAHDLFDGEKAADSAKIGATVACGYTFQGQLVRKQVVLLAKEKVLAEEPSAQDVLPGLAS